MAILQCVCIISPTAVDVLHALCAQEFYLDLRKNHQTADSTPITTRQLESLIRLTEVAQLDNAQDLLFLFHTSCFTGT